MVSGDEIRKWSLAFDEVYELPHFEKAAFLVRKKIFATLSPGGSRICVKLTVEDQLLFCSHDLKLIFPVANKWGKLGWTFVNLKRVSKALTKEVLLSAYCTVAPKKLTSRYKKAVTDIG
jgi:hypothetical protein